jgi:hypothetical protein
MGYAHGRIVAGEFMAASGALGDMPEAPRISRGFLRRRRRTVNSSRDLSRLRAVDSTSGVREPRPPPLELSLCQNGPMPSELTWIEPPTVCREDDWGPNFAVDSRFTHEWWHENANFGPPTHQWRSYQRDDEEVARVLLSLRYMSHSPGQSSPALLIWNIEVREGLRRSGNRFGTTVVDQIADEFSEREIYVGSIPESMEFWTRFGWPMCHCDDCRGRHMMVRRP